LVNPVLVLCESDLATLVKITNLIHDAVNAWNVPFMLGHSLEDHAKNASVRSDVLDGMVNKIIRRTHERGVPCFHQMIPSPHSITNLWGVVPLSYQIIQGVS
jgi:hypothetical protein